MITKACVGIGLTWIVCQMALLGSVSGSEKGALFLKQTETALTRDKWIITYIFPLNLFDKINTEFQNHMNNLRDLMRRAREEYIKKKDNGWFRYFYKDIMNNLMQISEEADLLNATRSEIIQSYREYKSIQRSKRAILGFLSPVFKEVFGLETTDSVNDMRSTIYNVEKGQRKLVHVVNSSLTLIKAVNEDVGKNVDRINFLQDKFRQISEKLVNDEENYRAFDVFAVLMFDLRSIVQNINNLIREMDAVFNDLRAKIDFWSVGHLTPSSIPPNEFREILSSIKDKLPGNLRLTADHVKDLFTFYKLAETASAILDGKILTVITIPLINTDQVYEIFKIYALPMPYHNPAKNKNPQNNKQLTAYYDIEEKYIAINKQRSRFALLSETDFDKCTRQENNVCNLKKAMYPTHNTKNCAVNLFLVDQAAITKECAVVVTHDITPRAIYIADAVWIVTTTKVIKLSLRCKGNNHPNRNIVVKPPLETVVLPNTCSAESPELALPASFKEESKYVRRDVLVKHITNLTNNTYNVFGKLKEELPKLSNINNWPEKLKNRKRLEVNELMAQLEQVAQNDVLKPEVSSWIYSVGIFVIIILILLIMSNWRKIKETLKAKRIIKHVPTVIMETRTEENTNMPLNPDNVYPKISVNG